MCVKLKSSGLKPGEIHMFLTSLGKGFGTWGFKGGQQYNVRLESIPNIWNDPKYKRGIITVDSFWESNKQFVHRDKKDIHIGILYNPEAEFSIITTEANELVRSYHGRMPLVLDFDNVLDFMDNKSAIIMSTNEMKLVA